mgnify:CR=1 FL=1
MSEVKMLTAPVPNVPWQERPQGPQNGAPIWRYSENPIIGRNPLKVLQEFLTVRLCHMVMLSSVCSVESRPMVFHIFILDTAKMPSTGILKKTRFRLWMKTASRLCQSMHTIQDL